MLKKVCVSLFAGVFLWGTQAMAAVPALNIKEEKAYLGFSRSHMNTSSEGMGKHTFDLNELYGTYILNSELAVNFSYAKSPRKSLEINGVPTTQKYQAYDIGAQYALEKGLAATVGLIKTDVKRDNGGGSNTTAPYLGLLYAETTDKSIGYMTAKWGTKYLGLSVGLAYELTPTTYFDLNYQWSRNKALEFNGVREAWTSKGIGFGVCYKFQ